MGQHVKNGLLFDGGTQSYMPKAIQKRERMGRHETGVNWCWAIINGCEKSMLLRGQQINAHIIADKNWYFSSWPQ